MSALRDAGSASNDAQTCTCSNHTPRREALGPSVQDLTCSPENPHSWPRSLLVYSNHDHLRLLRSRRVIRRAWACGPEDRRFSKAAEAIRYAVEKLPGKALPATSIEVDDERYDAGQIRALYENDGYPLARK